MASRSFSKSLRPLARQVTASPRLQQRSFTAARTAVRASAVAAVARPALFQQVRGVKTIDFAGHKEDVYGMPPLPALSANWLLEIMFG